MTPLERKVLRQALSMRADADDDIPSSGPSRQLRIHELDVAAELLRALDSGELDIRREVNA